MRLTIIIDENETGKSNTIHFLSISRNILVLLVEDIARSEIKINMIRGSWNFRKKTNFLKTTVLFHKLIL